MGRKKGAIKVKEEPKPVRTDDVFNMYAPSSRKEAHKLADELGYSHEEMEKTWNDYGRSKDAQLKTAKNQMKTMSMPIFSSKRGAWQFDTVLATNRKNAQNPYYLWFTNVNTKFTRAIPMKDKSSTSVEEALREFFRQNDKDGYPVTALTSDRDPAYQTSVIGEMFKERGIQYRTTEKDTKHGLGVINRNIRTIRGKISNTFRMRMKNGKMPKVSEDLEKEQVAMKIKGYNNKKHNDASMTPKELTSPEGEDEELNIIANKMNIADERREKATKDIHVGQKVRRFNPDVLYGKKYHGQFNLDPYNWYVHGIDKSSGYVWLGPDDDKHGLVRVPRYQVLTSKSHIGNKGMDVPPDHEDLKKRIAEITDRDKKGNYVVRYEDGTTEALTARQLRGNKPFEETENEVQFIAKRKVKPEGGTHMRTRSMSVFDDKPEAIENYLPKIMPDIPKVVKASERKKSRK